MWSCGPLRCNSQRVPIWVGGQWPKKGPARRAARWDGSVLNAGNPWEPPDPRVITELHDFIHTRRAEAGREGEPFDLVVGGSTPAKAAKARDTIGPLAEAGASWWDERFPIWETGQARRGPRPRRAGTAPLRLTPGSIAEQPRRAICFRPPRVVA